MAYKALQPINLGKLVLRNRFIMAAADDNMATDTDDATVQVQANQPPTVSITQPSDGETVNGTVGISGTASDPEGNLASVHIRFDDEDLWHNVVGTTNWTTLWDTTLMDNGDHIISARANDSVSDSEIVFITVVDEKTIIIATRVVYIITNWFGFAKIVWCISDIENRAGGNEIFINRQNLVTVQFENMVKNFARAGTGKIPIGVICQVDRRCRIGLGFIIYRQFIFFIQTIDDGDVQ